MSDLQGQNPRFHRLSRWGQGLSLLGLCVVAAVFAYALWFALTDLEGVQAALAENMDLPSVAGAPVVAILVAGVMWLLPDLIGAFMFWTLFEMFSGIRREGVFTNALATRVRRVGGLLLVMVPVGLITEALGTLSLTLFNAAGERSVRMSLDDTDVYALVVGMALFVLGHIMQDAVALAEENRSFV